ncbi:MAG: TonB-dependent receptor [Bacteroides sp.]|nr:TonB-dependent receptor [Bacteroides sp.]
MVTVRPSGGNRIIKYTQTSADGKFRLTFPQFPEEHILHVSILGYAPQSVALLRQQTVYNIRLQEQVTALKEVVIKAPSIHEKGDTIQYMVSRFADVQDRSLADVLKKMPGIEVEKSGAIKYNGVSINKFYIEGHDMLGGQYGLATNNIQQKDVGSVEVLQNHQPIKALEDLSFSQNPAINIRLKEDARSRWTGTAKLGLGASPLLWNVESSVMRFAAKKTKSEYIQDQ